MQFYVCVPQVLYQVQDANAHDTLTCFFMYKICSVYIYIYIYTHMFKGILINHEKQGHPTFLTTWVDLKVIMLSKSENISS